MTSCQVKRKASGVLHKPFVDESSLFIQKYIVCISRNQIFCILRIYYSLQVLFRVL